MIDVFDLIPLSDQEQSSLCKIVYRYTSLAQEHKQFHPKKLKELLNDNSELDSLYSAYVKAKEILVRTNSRLVMKMVSQRLPQSASEKEEMVQDGLIGLSIAIDKYNPTLKAKLVTYAYYWIFRELSPSSRRRFNGSVSFPAKVQYAARDVRDGSIAREDIAKKHSISVSFVREIEKIIPRLAPPIPFDQLDKQREANGRSIGFREEEIEKKEILEKIIKEVLLDSEKEVLFYMYLSPAPLTKKELSQKIGVSESMLSSIRKSAFLKIKNKILSERRFNLIDPNAYDQLN